MNSESRNGVLYLSGEVTVKTVASANYARFEQQCRAHEVHTLDLSGVTQADSACVSLLLTALRLKPAAVGFRGVPASVAALAELYEIKDWVSV
ncbi:STAS domain-containing protein [Uruburuella testudinis]|uniref:STAS domain-containing protein n=1 Tax=Uruburuella testudinis TaxID=1282863 RepID=A0ABY4DV50_9NEIS|nr:STAS domain-containing protein [Uruburuella testudinis]UOO81894.1 STAS domain-containing protein [Uruburuella testudinis]